jgi:RNA methyltransferase, TrmH family
MIIESMQNRHIKKILSLDYKKGRDETGLFIVEGEKFVRDIPIDWEVDTYFFSESFIFNNDIRGYEQRSKSYIVTDYIFKKITKTVTPQGIIAICHKKEHTIDEVVANENSFILIAENIADPGNLGTLIRTADATGCDGVLLTKGTVDLYNPKVIRATAGSIFNVKVIQNIDIQEILKYTKDNDITTFATHLKGESYIYDIDLTKSCAILIGNEGDGLTRTASEQSDFLVKIPIIGKAESLNASVASGVMLYEVVRQRR